MVLFQIPSFYSNGQSFQVIVDKIDIEDARLLLLIIVAECDMMLTVVFIVYGTIRSRELTML
jgi:hypothetical protein